MGVLTSAAGAVGDFLAAGGWVLYAIFATTVGMWTLIIERAWYLAGELPAQIHTVRSDWDRRDDHRSWFAKRIREQLIGQVAVAASRGLRLIKACMAVLPLLGLLGTVWGMITVFEALAVSGTGDARAMADGVYRATLPTMAGLLAALSGLYPASALERRAGAAVKRLEQALQ